MYKVYCDDYLIYSPSINTLQLTSATLNLELNKTGTFEFIIYPNHKYYDKLIKMKSIIRVYQDHKLIFSGRILNEELNIYNGKQVTCEGVLAFLLDSIIRPYNFTSSPKTTEELLSYFINQHNQAVDEYKQFKKGNVTVTTFDNKKIAAKNDKYETTWNAIQNELIDNLGGYLYVRFENDGAYIDYLKDFNDITNQPIIFGMNLLDLNRSVKGESIATAIIATGGSNESLVKLNYGNSPKQIKNHIYGLKDFIYDKDAVEKYGWITTANNFSDATTTSVLEDNAVKYLLETTQYLLSVEITAVDLSINNINFNSFELGKKIIFRSKYHILSEDENKAYLVEKLSIDLLDPTKNTIVISSEFRSSSGFMSYTEQNNKSKANVNDIVTLDNMINNQSNKVISIMGDIDTINSNMGDVNEQIIDICELLLTLNSTINSNYEKLDSRLKKLENQKE